MTVTPARTAGADIESICTKCGDVWHVIVAMVGNKIAKVQCKECNAYHRYRIPKAIKDQKRTSPRKRTTKKATGKAAMPAGPTVEPDTTRAIKPYGAGELFQVADRVEHVKFGIGVVELAVSGKITVYFSEGRRVLAQAREETKLQRPARFRHDTQ